MPNMDGTGPQGMGPMTGRGMGPCGQGGGQGFRGMRRGAGRGFGRGMGRMNAGAGNGANWNAPYQPTKDEYAKMLKDEIKDIQAELKDLEK